MGSNKRAVHEALRAALDSWNWRPPPSVRSEELAHTRPMSPPGVQTELSATVFSAEADEWVRYLTLAPDARCEAGVGVELHLQPELRLVAFEPENENSRWIAELLGEGLGRLRKQIEHKPHVLAALDELVFDNASNTRAPLRVLLSPEVPSDGTRETVFEEVAPNQEIRIVLHSRLLRYVHDALEGSLLSGDERLGVLWPVISTLISALAYPTSPRDRFVAKLDVFARLTFVAINVLYQGKKSGELVPSVVGEIYEGMVCESSHIARAVLMERHPYFRMLAQLGFLLRADPYKSYVDDVRVVAREYLDTLYLRLSLAGAMPEVPEAMQPMSFERKAHKLKTAPPEIGRYGVLDADDLDAWKTVADSFRDLGFTLLRQLGIGEFGRVYDAVNENNPSYPARIALKVDRIAGKKKQAILEAEEAMSVGRALARSPHLIRLYDTGKLRGQRFTYHVLQLIEGDTLDNLVGVTGTEHASVSRPPRAVESETEAEDEYKRALSLSGSQLWRRQRMNLPFTHALSPAMLLDLVSSVLLWLDEVHSAGYAINDLKNGNLMMSRRGQLKGIDLDSYGRVHSPKDKVTDFMFLAVSLILLLFSAPVIARGRSLPWEELIESEARLRSGLADSWPFGDVELLSDGRVSRQELTDALVDLVHRSRRLVYNKRPDIFSEDIGRLIRIKRRLLVEEMVVD